MHGNTYGISDVTLIYCTCRTAAFLLCAVRAMCDCDEAYVDRHTLAVNVNRLRGKIEDAEHKYISNVYGMGYQWLR